MRQLDHFHRHRLRLHLRAGRNGLRGLAALLLKHRISKSSQTSDWSRRKLSDTQITYAATDAWISLELFKKFKQDNYLCKS